MQIPTQSLTLGTVIIVAVGTVIYYYFKGNKNNAHRQDESDDGELPLGVPDLPPDERSRRRRNTLEDPNCIICLDALRTFTTRRLPCRHVLHLHCFRLWIRHNQPTPICPVCGRRAL